MAAFSSRFPVATHKIYDREDEEEKKRQLEESVSAGGSCSTSAPPYGHRRGWVPRCAADFADGGAFPEIIAAQYPLDMGRKKETSNALARQLDAEGNVKYDAIARQGHRKEKVVHAKYQDLVPSHMGDNDEDLERPSDDKLKEITDSTKDALNALVEKQISAAMPIQAAEKLAPAQYIRYTPANQGAAFNSGAKQRIIRMVEMQKDPMEPPKFKVNKKIPRGPPSPPAPVLHSPNRKVTVKEQQDWKIPPCISNWKNAKGFTIPLEKRLAADGRGLQTVHINENFAKLAESLYIADRKAREAVEMRAQIEKKMAQKEKDKKEEALRQLAQKARDESSGIGRQRGAPSNFADNGEEDDVRERDSLRKDRAKERQRERNIAKAAPDKRTRLQRDRERDISEKIALGMPSTAGSGGVQYDQRLFNQSKGMDSGFAGGEDEMYNVYDKPWRQSKDIGGSIYRPSNKGKDSEQYAEDLEKMIKSNRFVPDKEFSGTERGRSGPGGAGVRDGPVQFEKVEEDDPFGLNPFLSDAQKAQKRPGEESRYSSRDSERKRRH